MGTVLKFPVEKRRPRTLTVSEDKRGQRVMIFDAPPTSTGSPAKLIPLRPDSARERAYALYIRAGALDDDPHTYEEAEALYRQAIAIDAYLDVAYTNLGNVRFRRGFTKEAEDLYRKALSLSDVQPEAHYNLGYLFMEAGKIDLAITHLRRATDLDSRFADAHFNLAMALEQTRGDGRMRNKVQAKLHWRRYLDLEPRGAWADIARAHLK